MIHASVPSNSAPVTKRGSKVVAKRLIATPLASTPRETVQFVESGSYQLNRVLGGGGWALRRVSNLVGDKSSGKTLIAVEACANFMPLVRTVDDIRYVEAESAFDEAYGQQIGMPPGIEPVDTIRTVEGLFDDLFAFVTARKGLKTPCLYVVDSLDALSDDAEMAREIGEDSYGGAKAKKMSELFRRIIQPISDANCHLLIISQLRDNIGVRFGEKKKRSGGTALDFYASQIVWLSEIDKLERTVSGMKRTIGIKLQARNRKCKVGPPFQTTKISMWFGYGLDDEGSMLDWLAEHKANDGVNLDDLYKQITTCRRQGDRQWLKEVNLFLRDLVARKWDHIDSEIAPPMRKYA